VICIRCGTHLWISENPVKCPYCKTLNYPAPKPEFKSQTRPEYYQAKREKYSSQNQIRQPLPQPPTVGLGDAVEMVTRAIGIKPCGGCQKRKETFNRAVPNIRRPWRR